MPVIDRVFPFAEIADAFAYVEPGSHAYNPIGGVHGGGAVHSKLRANQIYTTLELKISYHRGMTVDTGTVRAIGSVLTIGRRTAFAEARLVDPNDRLLASATSTLLVMDLPS